jgi:hypothetical protein
VQVHPAFVHVGELLFEIVTTAKAEAQAQLELEICDVEVHTSSHESWNFMHMEWQVCQQ